MEECQETQSLYVYYNYLDNSMINVTRCCSLCEKEIPKKDFFNKSFEELANLAITNTFKNGHKCKFLSGCKFSKNIKEVWISSIAVCNLRCYHCIAGFDKSIGEYHPFDITKEEIINRKNFVFDILNFLKGKNLQEISLDGSGEIFMYYDELIEYLTTISSNDTKVFRFLTNATLLNEKKIIELYKLSKKTGVNYSFYISVDGISEKTFNACRPNADFKKVFNNLILIKKLFNLVDVTFTVKRPNIEDTPFIEDFFKKLGINLLWKYDYFDAEFCSQYSKAKR